MEMWRGRTPFLKGRVLRNGRPAKATVLFCLQGSDGEGNASWKEIKAELEISLPGGEARRLRGLFNGDRQASPYVWPGTELPVKLHPDRDDKLVVDWKAWQAEGGLDGAKARGDAQQAAEANAAVYQVPDAASTPALAADPAASAPVSGWQAQTIASWQSAVAAGRMSQEEYDKAVADLRAVGGG